MYLSVFLVLFKVICIEGYCNEYLNLVSLFHTEADKLNSLKGNNMNIEQRNQVIANVESNIAELNNEIIDKQKEIDSFEYEVSESDFDEFLDDVEESVIIAGMTFYPSDILKSCDPVAYRCAKADYESNFDLDDVEEYNDLKDELDGLEGKLEELESELEELQDQFDSLESED